MLHSTTILPQGGRRARYDQGRRKGFAAEDRHMNKDATRKPDSPQPKHLADLLARAADGDNQAWREVIGLYAQRVFAMAHSHLKNPELAEEITQSVFVTLAQKLPESKAGGYREQGSFEPWLFRITMNRVRDEARRSKRQASPIDPHEIARLGSSAESINPDQEPDPEVQRLRAAVDTLEGMDREIIDLRHIGGMSFKQISAVLDCPIGTVLARHHRALKKLRNTMESKAFGSQTNA